MTTYIALLRGINVGGHNKLPMAALVTLLEDLGLRSVRTYIQSGNAVFRSDMADAADLAPRITAAIEAAHGFAPHVLLLTGDDLRHAAASNPYPQATAEPKTLHLYFLAEAPANPDLAMLEDVRGENERFELHDRVFYLYAPDGIGRSKLADKVGKALDVPQTARNWRTVDRLLRMADEVEHGAD